MEMHVITPRDAAIAAKTYGTVVYWAVEKGYLEARREGNRIYILRESFERWRKRLEQKRRIRAEEMESVKR